MRLCRFVTAVCAAALMFAAGCDRSDTQSFASEADEPNFRQGQQLVKQGRNQEALAAYLKVIAKRGESAPESHLEVGLLYLEQIKDPLAAIYHFRKYLELQPNSRQAALVKARIDVAKREFARTLPAQPLESQAEQLGLLDKVTQLQRENDDLKAELSTLRNGTTAPMIRSRGSLDEPTPSRETPRNETGGDGSPMITLRTSPSEQPAATTGGDESPVSLAPDSMSAPAENPRIVQAQPAPTRTVPTKPTPPASAGGRRHTVAKGDTLFSLAQKYYGNRSRWRDIYNANRDVLPSENSLRLGMEIKIP